MNTIIEDIIKAQINNINANNWGKVIEYIKSNYKFEDNFLGNSISLFHTLKQCDIIISDEDIKDTFNKLGYKNCKIIPLYNQIKEDTLKASEDILSNYVLDSLVVSDFINVQGKSSLYEIIQSAKRILGPDIDVFEPYNYNKLDIISNPIPIKIELYYEGMGPHLILYVTIGETDSSIYTYILYYDTIGYFIPGFGIAINTQLFNDYVNNLVTGLH